MDDICQRPWLHNYPEPMRCDILAHHLTPSADVPACRDEDPAHAAVLAACYPDPPEYQHPDGDPTDDNRYPDDFGDDTWHRG